ncbi:MAG: hypothetical protein AAFV49_03675 [Pseudomonadota bacterium]
MLGYAITTIGLLAALGAIGLLIGCILQARRIRRGSANNAAETGADAAAFRRLMLLNSVALGLGGFGLAIMIVGSLL